VLPPAATTRYLNGEFAFGWVGLRLTAGSAGIPALQRHLATVADGVDRMFFVPPGTIRLNIRRLDIVHHEVQQGSSRRRSRWPCSEGWRRWRCLCWQARP
jgi:hypothetical protein